ncbi:MAG: TolC family protein [Mucilaginibacter sp.]|uniref:TolC family protein n=1 Tax=Mucilaginibacter sp. TaxID=1882438 RepID=UPI003267BAC7
MKKNLVYTLSLILLLLPLTKSLAQESIMNDIDYPFLQKLINSAKQNYSAVKIRQAQVDIAKTTYNQTKLAWFDGLSVSYVYSPANAINLTSNNNISSGTSTGNTVNPNIFQGYQAAVAVNFGSILRNPSNTKNAKANYNIALLEQEALLNSLETQVRKLYLTYVQMNATLRIRTKTAQDLAISLNLAKRQFEKGNETVENYTRATTAFSEVNQAKIEAEVAVLNAKTALEEIVGKKLEEIK